MLIILEPLADIRKQTDTSRHPLHSENCASASRFSQNVEAIERLERTELFFASSFHMSSIEEVKERSKQGSDVQEEVEKVYSGKPLASQLYHAHARDACRLSSIK